MANRDHRPPTNHSCETHDTITDSGNGLVRVTGNVHPAVSGLPTLIRGIEPTHNLRALQRPDPPGLRGGNQGEDGECHTGSAGQPFQHGGTVTDPDGGGEER